MSRATTISSLVTVVIPCYNHGHYLGTAIESVLQQSYREVEILVVDDGSSDETANVAQSYDGVRYLYQKNQGLSAARNTGIANSRGAYLVFLDADDWLYPEALATNLRYLQQNPTSAFVSGAHDKVFTDRNTIVEESIRVDDKHFEKLLQGNYIGMHATVMYQRFVFDYFTFDFGMKTCEDYDLYLRIARKHPVIHHTDKIAAYRLHNTNMSSNIPQMLQDSLFVLQRQKPNLKSKDELNAYYSGRKIWKNYYSNLLYKKLIKQGISTKAELKALFRFRPYLYAKYYLRFVFSNLRLKASLL